MKRRLQLRYFAFNACQSVPANGKIGYRDNVRGAYTVPAYKREAVLKRITLAVVALLALSGGTAGAQIFPGETPAQIAARMAKFDSAERARERGDAFNNMKNPKDSAGRALAALVDSLKRAGEAQGRASMAAIAAREKHCGGFTRLGVSERVVRCMDGDPIAINSDISRSGTTEQWVYADQYIYFTNGRVTYIQLRPRRLGR